MVGRRFPARELAMDIGAQVMGGIVATIVLYVIATGKPGVELPQIATYPVTRSVCLRDWRICQVVLTFMCPIVILAVADNAGKRDLPIGGRRA